MSRIRYSIVEQGLQDLDIVSPCPYARRGRLLGVTITDPNRLFHAALALQHYARATDVHEEVMFAVRISGAIIADGPLSLAGVFRYLVHYANGPGESRSRLYDRLTDPGWRLSIGPTELFAIVLSPTYPNTHHRYTEDSSLFLFQPEALFTHFGITTGSRRATVSEAVSRRFERSGRPYRSAHVQGVPKALRIVLTLAGTGVEWWKCPLPAAVESLPKHLPPREGSAAYFPPQEDRPYSTATVEHGGRTLQDQYR
jgi:hypothetical protein